MSTVARHKKPGGFRKLVNSLETTPVDKRIKILDVMRQEDVNFVKDVWHCIFNFDEFAQVEDNVILEVIGAFRKELRTIAIALFHSTNQELVAKFTKNLHGNETYEFAEFSEGLHDVPAREQAAARFRIIAKARELEGQRKIKLKKYNENYRDDG